MPFSQPSFKLSSLLSRICFLKALHAAPEPEIGSRETNPHPPSKVCVPAYGLLGEQSFRRRTVGFVRGFRAEMSVLGVSGHEGLAKRSMAHALDLGHQDSLQHP